MHNKPHSDQAKERISMALTGKKYPNRRSTNNTLNGRICSMCHLEKALSEFHIIHLSNGRSYHCIYCKACKSALAKEYYLRRKEFLKKQTNDYYHAHREQYLRNYRVKLAIRKLSKKII